MNAIDKFFKGSKNVTRSAFLWNMMSSGLLAVQAVIVMMLLTRTIGVEDAGVFSFAHSNANLMFFIGEFGCRRFQASDVKEKYSPGEYYAYRSLSCVLMIVALLIFCVNAYVSGEYTVAKTLTVFFVGMCLVVQALSDGHEANMQQKGRLDIAAKGAFARTMSLILAYFIGIFLTKSLVISSVLAFCMALVTFLTTTFRFSADFGSRRPVYNLQSIRTLFIAVLPIFLTLFLNNYIGNAPKYAIDSTLGDEIQAIYGFLFMPTYAISVACGFIFNPIIVKYSTLWVDGNIKEFRRLVFRQMILVGGLTLIALAGGFLLGIPVLSAIFGTSLVGYRTELCILIIGGGMYAFCVFFTTVTTIMRRQNTLLVGYVIAAAAMLLFSKKIIVAYGLMGAAIMYTLIMTVLAALLFVFCIIGIKKRMAERADF